MFVLARYKMESKLESSATSSVIPELHTHCAYRVVLVALRLRYSRDGSTKPARKWLSSEKNALH